MKLSTRLLALPLILFGLLLAGCDSSGDDDGFPIEGTWGRTSADSGENFYIDASENEYEEFEQVALGCYRVYDFDIVEKDGNTYTLEGTNNSGPFTTTRDLTVQEDRVRLVYPDGNQIVLDRIDEIPSDINNC